MCHIARRDRQPRRLLAEPGVSRAAPLHRSALAISSLLRRPARFADRILHILPALWIVILHPYLFAVIHDWRAAQRQVKSRHQFRDGIVVLAVPVPIV